MRSYKQTEKESKLYMLKEASARTRSQSYQLDNDWDWKIEGASDKINILETENSTLKLENAKLQQEIEDLRNLVSELSIKPLISRI